MRDRCEIMTALKARSLNSCICAMLLRSAFTVVLIAAFFLPGPTVRAESKHEAIKAYCLDFNWAPTNRRGRPFAKPGQWAGADPASHVAWYKDMGANVIQTFAVSTNGYAWYKDGFVPEQPGLKHDFLTEVVKLGHEEGMKVFGYFCAASNPRWAELRPELSYGSPTTYHIPYTDEYLEYFSKSIHDAVKKTGMDGFMVDWLWMPRRSSTEGKWLPCEKDLYRQLMEEEFPGEDKLTKQQDTAFSRKCLERCWDAIKKAAKTANPECIVWLTVNKMHHEHVTNSRIYKEVDWLMNEAGSLEAIRKAKGMVGDHTRLITCLAVWNGMDASATVPAAIEEGVGLYGFTTPRGNAGLVDFNKFFDKQVSELSGDQKNIATLARAYRGKSEYARWHEGEFREPKIVTPFRLTFQRRGRGLQDTARIDNEGHGKFEITVNSPYASGSGKLTRTGDRWPESLVLQFQKKPGEVAEFLRFGLSDGKTGWTIPFAGSAAPATGEIDPKAKVDRHSGLRFGFKGTPGGFEVEADKNSERTRIVLPKGILSTNAEVLEFSWGGKP